MHIKFLVGASVVLVSVLPDLDRTFSTISVYYRPTGGAWSSSSDFKYVYNDFHCALENLSPSTTYEMYVRVIYGGTPQTYSTITFTTKELGTCVSNVDPNYGTAAQRLVISNDMDVVVGRLNAVGYTGTSLYAKFDSSMSTAAANMRGILVGPQFANESVPWATRLQVYTHELRHYFGIGDAFWSGTPPQSSKRARNQTTSIKFYDNWSNAIGASNHYDYCLDLVHQFKTGSDIAFVNFNYDHSSIINGVEWVDYFMLMACISASAFSSMSYTKSASNPIFSSYYPRVQLYTSQSDVSYVPTSLTAHGGTVRFTGDFTYIASLVNQYTTAASLGSEITSVPQYSVFKDKTNLVSVSTSSATTIGAFAFNNCANLSSVTFGSGLVTVENDSFGDCPSITSVELPEGLTTIGARAFKGCTSLTTFTIPSTFATMGNTIFEGCTSLTTLNVYAETPPTTTRTLFSGSAPDNFTIHVPSGRKKAYQRTAWSVYNIVDDL